ncbi:MAG: hypothetical protein FJ309_12330 [Planctomycetes bacterium]|nr:hypothetical protein [Planctomycetota bacterium]
MSAANEGPMIPRAAWVIALALVATGCTMCPDPFDYSGPVPNGSAPQNDFMARSNGILPLRAKPAPWPPLVEAETGAAETAVAADSPESAADETAVIVTADAPDADGDATVIR